MILELNEFKKNSSVQTPSGLNRSLAVEYYFFHTKLSRDDCYNKIISNNDINYDLYVIPKDDFDFIFIIPSIFIYECHFYNSFSNMNGIFIIPLYLYFMIAILLTLIFFVTVLDLESKGFVVEKLVVQR